MNAFSALYRLPPSTSQISCMIFFMLLLTRGWGTSDEYITALEWGISAPSNWYSYAILKNSMFSNTSALFVDPRSWHIISLSPAPIKIG